MDENRIAGTVRTGAGKVESAVGGALGDTKTQAQGNIDTAHGRVQDAVGQAKDAVRDVADHAGEYAGQAYEQASDLAGRAYGQAADLASDAYESGGRYYREGADLVRRNPATASLGALALAGVIGYLIAQLFRSGSSGGYSSARYGRDTRYGRGRDHDDNRAERSRVRL
jgi:uncharacterized protein YjbJ (UPF0337 family)